MTTGPVIVVGAGPAGMAAALAMHRIGHEVMLLERYSEALPAGSGLSLFAPVVKALAALGVDTRDLGAPCSVVFERQDGRVLADIKFPPEVGAYGGGFFGLLRPALYRRMSAALPAGVLQPDRTVTGIKDRGDDVLVELADGERISAALVIGADGINSTVRTTLWGPSPIREHRLHVLCGFTFDLPPSARRDVCAIGLDGVIQASYSEIVDDGRRGHQWWIIEAWDPETPPPADLHERAAKLAADYGSPMPDLVAATRPEDVFRWQIRDRKPIKKWSKGRVTLAGDSAHATSPYAAYGAGMGIGDGYFLGQVLAGVDLADRDAVTAALRRYEDHRVHHTSSQVQLAYILGQVLHRVPAPLRPVRDLFLNRSGILQKRVGEKSPGEIVAQLEEMDDRVFSLR
ncbi:FAD-binding protein [Actinomadura sp. LD22]|uniref:FAD-binding protein n=1 Tax=Actinomadura physcomitrii TaxID=2650748 RepID=A0A6I4MGU9_9ACTN|nr:FAD-dependent monooxygenase [Actinomadura physcomitrii]MWA02951.1 FAD-binding protein [Actinomadura physcomitrii]